MSVEDEEWHNDEDQGPEEDAVDEDPRSRWSTAAEIGGGLLALVLVSVGVLALYVASGVAVGVMSYLLSTAAPAILALGAALFLARYLSRR